MLTRQQTVRRRLAGIAVSVFGVAFAALLVAQLALMSLLDTGRADEAARTVSQSRFVTNLLDDSVRNAVRPLAGDEVADQAALIAVADPRVRDVVRLSLVGAHRQVVDPSAPRGVDAGAVNATVADVLTAASAQTGVDLSEAGARVRVPEARPEQIPDVGLRAIAVRTRLVAALVAVLAAVLSVAVHPRPARGLATIGATAGVACAGWGIGLLVAGRIIDRFADTLFGEMLDALWSSAAPAMIALVIAGALLGAGTWLGGRAVDGLLDARTRSSRPATTSAPASTGIDTWR